MSRKKLTISCLVVLCVSLIFIVYFGERRNKAIHAEQVKSGTMVSLNWEEIELQRKEDEINKWKPNGNPRSFIDDVRYYKALDRTVSISTLGSSVTSGTGSSDRSKAWVAQLAAYLRGVDEFTNISVTNNGFGGYSTSKLLVENKVDAVISQKPDIILFETCLINDHGGVNGSNPVDQTIKNISEIVDKLQNGLPDAKIIIMSPNPLGTKANVSNKLNLKLDDYAAKTKEFILSKGWSYIDVYGEFKGQKADMNSLTIEDGIHPNDDGYKMWFEIMKQEFEKVQ